jgi:hypothetical protein
MNGNIYEIDGYEENLLANYKQTLMFVVGAVVGGLLMCLI